jgi:uncharacterized protein YndB with AHSA1/START domain
MSTYRLATEWRLAAPVESVWAAIARPADWPRWWRHVEAVTELEPGDAQGVGAVRRFTWSSRLPYRLTFDMRTTSVQAPFSTSGEAQGDLQGTGRWTLRPEPDGCNVRYDWEVATSKAWMNALAPLLAPAFAWNHHAVMRAGGDGLARHLGVPFLGFRAAQA